MHLLDGLLCQLRLRQFNFLQGCLVDLFEKLYCVFLFLLEVCSQAEKDVLLRFWLLSGLRQFLLTLAHLNLILESVLFILSLLLQYFLCILSCFLKEKLMFNFFLHLSFLHLLSFYQCKLYSVRHDDSWLLSNLKRLNYGIKVRFGMGLVDERFNLGLLHLTQLCCSK